MQKHSPEPLAGFNLIQEHRAYKRLTNVFLQWLIGQCNSCATENHRLTVKRVEDMIKVAKATGSVPPINVIKDLARAIEKRHMITAYFKSGPNAADPSFNEVTRSHEFFTSLLKGALSSFQSVTTRHCPTKLATSAVGSPTSPHILGNIYEHLSVESIEINQTDESDLPGEDQVPENVSESASDNPQESQLLVEDDALETIFQLLELVHELDTICSILNIVWEQAGRGEESILLAAWMANAGYKAMERLIASYANLIPCHRDFLVKYTFKLRSLHIILRPTVDIAQPHSPFLDGKGLISGWLALTDFKFTRQHSEHLMTGRLFEKASDHITVQDGFRDGPRQTEAEHITMDLMLKTMKQILVAREELDLESSFASNPLLEEVHRFLQSDQNSADTSLIVGFQLLGESFKSFLHCGPKSTKANCHVLALKYVQEVKDNVQSVLKTAERLGCGCKSCNERQLRNQILSFELELSLYLADKRFDLYYQTPWVAGQHMLKTWSLATDYGLLLCEVSNAVAVTLHLHNMLIQIKRSETPIPLLASLSQQLGQSVFLGPPPFMSFHSCLVRYLGGRVDFAHHRNGCESTPRWRLKVPTPSSRIHEDGNRRLAPSNVSRFYLKNNARYHLELEIWADVLGTKSASKATSADKSKAVSLLVGDPFACALNQMKAYIDPEFDGEIPLVKLNYFAIHLSCTRALSHFVLLHQHGMGNTDLRQENITAEDSQRSVISLLEEVDRHGQSRELGMLFPYLSSLRLARDALLHEFGDKATKDYLWQNLV